MSSSNKDWLDPEEFLFFIEIEDIKAPVKGTDTIFIKRGAIATWRVIDTETCQLIEITTTWGQRMTVGSDDPIGWLNDGKYTTRFRPDDESPSFEADH